jgi:type I restriction enzyme S subunit
MRPYVRAANVTWGGWDFSDLKEMNFDAGDFERYRLQPGDVLINEGSGSAREVGKAAIWNGEIRDCCFQNTLLCVRPKACAPKFVHNYVRWCARAGKLVASTQGVNIFHIGRQGLANHPIPVPPLPEQHRIVAKIEALSARLKRASADLDRVAVLTARAKGSILDAAYRGDLTKAQEPWEPRPLSTLLTDLRYGTSRKCGRKGAVPVLRIPNVQSGEISLSDLKFADFDRLELRRLSLESGDVLMVRSNGSVSLVGRCAVVPQPAAGMLFAGYLIRLRVDRTRMDPEFLHLMLSSPTSRTRIEAEAKSTSGVNNINSKQIEGFLVPCPPLDEQIATALRAKTLVRSLDLLSRETSGASALLDRLDQSILAKAFRGELVPQDPDDEPASTLLDRIRPQREAASAPRRRGRNPQAEA